MAFGWLFFSCAVIAVVTVLPASCAPSGGEYSGPQMTFDQRQSGEYNVQVHLKDFQVIALVPDDSLALGDYDYHYDYSDLTVKPGGSTIKPHLNATTIKVDVATQITEKPSIQNQSSVLKPMHKFNASSIAVLIAENGSATTEEVEEVTSPYLGPDKIHVRVEKPVTNIAIVQSEEDGVKNHQKQQQQQHHLGQIFHNGRCAAGFTKDKRGRCRKIKRPGRFPFSLTRLATNLASKFRRSFDADV